MPETRMSEHCQDCQRNDRFNVMMSGAIGGGFLLVGFGLPWGIVGMVAGAGFAYWTEMRRAAHRRADDDGREGAEE